MGLFIIQREGPSGQVVRIKAIYAHSKMHAWQRLLMTSLYLDLEANGKDQAMGLYLSPTGRVYRHTLFISQLQ